MSHKRTFLFALPLSLLLCGGVASAQNMPFPPAMGPQMAEATKNPVEFHKSMCGEHYARKSAHLAYLEAKLNLSDKQKAAWTKWSQWELQSAQQQRDACLEITPKADGKLTAPERESMMEKQMSLRLQGLQNSRPALQTLYDLLTPEQRTIFDSAPRHHDGGRHFD